MDYAPKNLPNAEGITIVSRTKEPSGIERTHVRLEAGSYEAETGFRPYGQFEDDWSSAASDDVETMAAPFPLDIAHPDIRRLANSLFNPLTATPNDPHFIEKIEERFQMLVPSAHHSVEERYERLSDIVLSNTATCAATCDLLGTLLVHQYPGLRVEQVDGQYGPIRNGKISYPFKHQWLRIESARHVFLYDPMYHHSATFEKQGDRMRPLRGDVDEFRKHSVELRYVNRFVRELLPTTLSENIVSVAKYNNTDEDFFLDSEAGYAAQVYGRALFSFDVPEAMETTLWNGHFRIPYHRGASCYYPMTIRKESSETA